MKDRRFYRMAEASNLLMGILLYQSVYLFARVIAGEAFSLTGALVVTAMVLFSYFSGLLISHFIPYGLLHIVFFGLLFLTPKDESRWMLFALYIAIFIIDIARWIRQKKGNVSFFFIAAIAIPALGHFYCGIKKNPGGMRYFFIFGLMYFFFYFLRKYFINAYRLSEEKSRDEKMPFRDMMKSTAGIVFPFLLICILLMVVFRTDAFEKALIAFYDFGMKMVIKLIHFIIMVVKWLESLVQKKSDRVPLEDFEQVAGETVSEGNLIVRIISTIVVFSMAGVIFAAIIHVIVSFIKLIPMKRKLPTETIEDKEKAMVEIREKIVKTNRRKKEKLSRVRKLYKKSVEKEAHGGYDVRLYHTPRERMKDLYLQKGRDTKELVSQYEKARYH